MRHQYVHCSSEFCKPLQAQVLGPLCAAFGNGKAVMQETAESFLGHRGCFLEWDCGTLDLSWLVQ